MHEEMGASDKVPVRGPTTLALRAYLVKMRPVQFGGALLKPVL